MPTMLFTALQKYAVFKGRARRKEYWQLILLSFLVQIAAAIIDRVLGLSGYGNRGPFSLIASLAFLVPSIAAGVRRMHDTDHSGWYLLIPFYNFYLAVINGTPRPNRYGPDPKGAALGEVFA